MGGMFDGFIPGVAKTINISKRGRTFWIPISETYWYGVDFVPFAMRGFTLGIFCVSTKNMDKEKKIAYNINIPPRVGGV